MGRRRSGAIGSLKRSLWLGLALAVGCGSGGGEGGASTSRAPGDDEAAEPLWFESVASEVGVDFQHGFGPVRWWMPEVGASGLGLFDMDGDGDLDLYVLQGADLEPTGDGARFDAQNRLYENVGDGVFEDVTDRAGVGDTGFGYGLAVGDYDGDGRLDLYVTNVGPNVLYRNLGDGRFQDVTRESGTATVGWGTSASFVDFDLDGHLDLFVVNYIEWSPNDEVPCRSSRGERTYCSPNRYTGPAQDRLLRNRGDGTFEDVSEEKGLSSAFGNGLGLVWGRLDDRPGIDVYVANDGMANQFWSGADSGPMEDRAMILGCALSGDGVAEAGMGVVMEDMDRDGQWDLMVTHLAGETNTFYMGGRRGYRDRTASSGTMAASRSYTGFGVGVADFDHDGALDLYVANGRVILQGTILDPDAPLAEPDQLFRGAMDGSFEEVPFEAISDSTDLTVARGAAFGDIDNDGDVDVCLNDYGGPLRILRNVAPKKGGAATWSVLERDGLPAIGAIVRFEWKGTQVQRQVQRTYSYCASSDPRLHVGLGDVPLVQSVEVTWLDGAQETFGPLRAGEASTLRRGEGRAIR